MLTINELAREVEARNGLKPQLTKNVIKTLAEIAAEEVGAGEDFTIPGLVRFAWRYRPKVVKGEKYRKGDEYTGFGGVVNVAEADSAARPAQVKLAVLPLGQVNKLKPRKATMGDFLKSKAGKAVAKRKG